ncbi:MAG: hypothetical protein R3298_03110 [Gammaproteobacteria bacterium]|nr:hypothetical protein [Gammaproteobacteria bacterium]
MQHYLVIGATGVMGTAAIRAVRETQGHDAHVVGVWYGREDNAPDVPGVDRLLFLDIGDENAMTTLAREAGPSFDWCFYATALGDVGFPVHEATSEQIASSNRLSFDPLPRLEVGLEIGALVGYSTFYNLAHQKITYGAMGHSKHAIERWALEQGRSRRFCVRAGAFRSASSQGIKLLVRRKAKALAQSSDPLLRSFFADAKPSEAVERLEQAVFDEEREVLGDSGTDLESLVMAHKALLEGPDAPFVNVAGRRVWTSSEPLAID